MKTRSAVTAIALSIAMCVSLLVRPVLGQVTTATILGTVADEAGGAIPQATVTVTNVETGISRTAITDDAGRYRVPLLSPGNYEVKVTRNGFASEVRSGIEMTVGREAVLDFMLKTGKVDETITIKSEAPLVDTTNSTLAGLVNERRIVELPLNGRDVFQLTTLQVGVANTAAITFGGPMDVGPGKTKIAVNGARTTSNNFLLDGTSVNDSFNSTPGGLSGGFAGVDAIREFEILTNNYGAEYSSAGGAIVNAVSKSGVNAIHGTAFEFIRNSALDARNFFDVGDAPPFKRNQFGGSFGGPIIKDKTFIFGAYEGLRERLGVTSIFAVPDAASRAMAVPSVQPYVNLYPQPNGPELGNGAANYIRSSSNRTRDDFFTTRVDHQLSTKDSLFARYTFDDSNTFVQDQVIQNTSTQGRNQYVTIGEDHIFSPTLINTFRFGFDRSVIHSEQPFSVDVPASLSFIPGEPLGSFYGITEVAPLSSSLYSPRIFAYNSFEFNDQVSITHGAHALKTGVLVTRYQLNANSNLAVQGVYVYQGLGTITSLQAFLLGLPVAFQGPVPGSSFYRGIRETAVGAFFKDDWKVSNRLTLNLGLRYQFITVPSESNGKVATLLNPTDPAPTTGVPFFKNPTKKNFEPRVGFAWDVTGDGKTSLRGGYGIFDLLVLPFDVRYQMSDQAPFAKLGLVIGPPPIFFPAPFPNAYQTITTNAVPSPPAINAYTGDPKRAYMQQWNLTFQREIFPTVVATVSYVGSKGTHLPIDNELSIRTDGTVIDGHDGFPTLPPGVSPSSKRLNPNFGQLSYISTEGNSSYNALQVRIDKRFSHGLDVQGSYTWSKAIDITDAADGLFTSSAGGGRMQNSYDPSDDRGRAGFDARHNLVISATYLLPRAEKLHGLASKLVNGWETNAILTARSGYPFSVFIGFDRANEASAGGLAQRPDLVPGRSFSSAVTGDPNRYIDPTAFMLQPENTYGNAGRNILTGPNLITLDMGLVKNTRATEKLNIQFRAEFFNLLNRANFANPTNTTIFTDATGAVSGSFGQITYTSTPSRQIQFGLKFVF